MGRHLQAEIMPCLVKLSRVKDHDEALAARDETRVLNKKWWEPWFRQANYRKRSFLLWTCRTFRQ